MLIVNFRPYVDIREIKQPQQMDAILTCFLYPFTSYMKNDDFCSLSTDRCNHSKLRPRTASCADAKTDKEKTGEFQGQKLQWKDETGSR